VKVAVKDGFIRLKSIQLAGKKRMSVEEFLRGNKLTEAYRME
jgi:methionyl-tRNA formyltransferase